MSITLKEAIAKFPRNEEKIIETVIPENFKELPYIEKIKYVGFRNQKAFVNVSDGKLFFGIKTQEVCRRGTTFWLKTLWPQTIVIENNRIKANISYSYIDVFFNFINNNLVKDLSTQEKIILCKPSMIRDMLCEKIYGIETFYKAYMLHSYHLKQFNWRLFRDYVKDSKYVSILDLQAFTVSLEDSMKVLCTIRDTWTPEYSILKDLINSAIKLGEKVNLRWSQKRIHEEHLRQTRTLMQKEIANKPTIKIYDTNLGSNDIKLLNCEQDVFLEGLTMHHCLYTCYWSRIKSKNYIAFHMISPEDCTFSVRLSSNNDSVQLDQIYLARDINVHSETKRKAEDFITLNQKELFKLLTES